MKYELKQHFQIESARFLPHLPKEHPCSRLHGHSFKIILRLVGELHPQIGWVQDYHEISSAVQPVLNLIDHRVLNEVSGLENPTSELLARWLYEKLKTHLPLLQAVTIMETAQTECTYPFKSELT